MSLSHLNQLQNLHLNLKNRKKQLCYTVFMLALLSTAHIESRRASCTLLDILSGLG